MRLRTTTCISFGYVNCSPLPLLRWVFHRPLAWLAWLLVAAVVGWIMSWQNGRNLLPAAMQMQAHLGFFVVRVDPVRVCMDDRDVLHGLHSTFSGTCSGLFLSSDDPLMFFFWFVPVVAWLFLDCVLLWKGVSAVRYANR